MEPIHQNPQIELLYYWNAMLEVIIKIGDLFDSDEIDSFRLSV